MLIDPSGFGAYNLGEAVLETKGLQSNFKITPDELSKAFPNFHPMGALDIREVSPELLAKLVELQASGMRKKIEELLWKGETPANPFNGFLAFLLGDAGTVDVDNYAALTKDNIAAKLRDTRDSLSGAISEDENFKLFVSKNTFRLLRTAQQDQTGKGIDITHGGIPAIDSCPVVALPGMADNTIVGAISYPGIESNLVIGTDASWGAVNIGRIQNYGHEWFVQFSAKVGVTVVKPYEVALYSPEGGE